VYNDTVDVVLTGTDPDFAGDYSKDDLVYSAAFASFPSGAMPVAQGSGTTTPIGEYRRTYKLSASGTYSLTASVTDIGGLTSVPVAVGFSVAPSVAKSSVSPVVQAVPPLGTGTFTLASIDQFDASIGGTAAWTVSGLGSVSAIASNASVFTAGTTQGVAFVTGSSLSPSNHRGVRGTAAVVVIAATAPDVNGDGVSDVSAGEISPPSGASLNFASADTDSDGFVNAAEGVAGTSRFTVDTDRDGVPDATDAYPLDPSRSAVPPNNSSDTTPPTLGLVLPAGATPLP
jgi:hypothetical protein